MDALTQKQYARQLDAHRRALAYENALEEERLEQGASAHTMQIAQVRALKHAAKHSSGSSARSVGWQMFAIAAIGVALFQDILDFVFLALSFVGVGVVLSLVFSITLGTITALFLRVAIFGGLGVFKGTRARLALMIATIGQMIDMIPILGDVLPTATISAIYTYAIISIERRRKKKKYAKKHF